ncbi:PDZ domain-containing protein [Paraglaciecola aquimarina]|uniref:PDZ domain-containing protein n=1 Tax=Paraglaciecola aquimarina TaxID=1235557 RepID=A0ABU3SXW3_9ALTE|nr:PDZ domain-containing protein [Paraglaciecola aquimarina]MDU0354856.1 PDZ domain-containing protein [Paraglaciecola aquimarina]
MQAAKPNIHYQVTLSSIAGHTFDVKLTIDKPNISGQVLSLPAWIPGSYMIRDFAKNIISIAAKDDAGNTLTIEKLDKQSWKLPPTAKKAHVTYQIYAYDLSVRGAYINDEYAFFNGTNMFLAVEGQTQQPSSLRLVKPDSAKLAHWQVATTMPSHHPLSHQFGEYWANNYDELIDHPVLMGEFDIIPFSTSGVQFELILAGGHQADMARIQQDLSIICQHQIDFFSDQPPVKHYQFITLLTDNAFGGLEHISSTALMYSRKDLPSPYQQGKMTDGYQVFLSLCSHEFFHTWHVKRIKPEELFEASLDSEKYTEQLWIYEGFTSYYDDLSLLRCGRITQDEYLKIMSKNLTRLLCNKGRFKQTITESSFDAWTKFYKQDEGAVNNIVSYYNKGAVVAMCLDLSIRLASNKQYSLDDVMRHLWFNHGKVNVATHPTVIHDIVRESLGLDLSDFLDAALYSTEELHFENLLSQFGVDVINQVKDNIDDKGGNINKEPLLYDFGALCADKEIGVAITQVSEFTSAYEAGLQVGDVLIAMNNWQVSKASIKHIINNLTLGQTSELIVLRDKKLKKLSFEAKPTQHDTIYLNINNPQLATSWLG